MLVLQYLQTICFEQPTNFIRLSGSVGGPAPVKTETNDLLPVCILGLETLCKKAVVTKQCPCFARLTLVFVGRGLRGGGSGGVLGLEKLISQVGGVSRALRMCGARHLVLGVCGSIFD